MLAVTEPKVMKLCTRCNKKFARSTHWNKLCDDCRSL